MGQGPSLHKLFKVKYAPLRRMKEVSLTKPLFGKEAEIVLYGIDEALAVPIIEKAYEEALRLHRIFNFYDPDSELSKLNLKRKSIVSDELLFVIKMALRLSEQTSGRYDVTLGRLFRDRKEAKQSKPVSCSYKGVQIAGNTITILHPDILIDLGSIAKGYVVDKMVSYLKAQGVISGLIDARGDIRVFGVNQSIDIQHPRHAEQIIASLSVRDAIATSGDYNQYHGSYKNSHILNQEELISVTVLAKTLTTADAFATVLFVCRQEERERIIRRNNLTALTVDTNLEVKRYNWPKLAVA